MNTFKHPLHRNHLSSSVGVWKHKTVRLDSVPNPNHWQNSHGDVLAVHYCAKEILLNVT